MFMVTRDPNLAIIIDRSLEAILSQATGPAALAGKRILDRLATVQGNAAAVAAERFPLCEHRLDAVYSSMAAEASPLPDIASAFAAIEGRLRWTHRKGVTAADQPFFDGHANAMLIGPGGLEQRDDVWVGATLMAPGVLYPDHSHPPEEVYLALTGGEWWNAAMDWTEPGPGGIIYNPPGILHAMRSGEKPFLALWFLPIGG